LKDGHAEKFHNVTIQWSKGAPPTMTIVDLTTGEDRKRIDLAEYNDKDRLNQLMLEEGFRHRTEAEEEVWQKERAEIKERELLERKKLVEDRKKKAEERRKRMDEEAAKLKDKEKEEL
jgi:Sep15/SelM redox domain